MSFPDVRRLNASNELRGVDAEDTALLLAMLGEAEEYVSSFEWCPPIRERYFGCGVGGVVALFLFRFSEKIGGTDDAFWVVVGDLPSAYFVVDEAPDPPAALEVYCELMEEWAQAVLDERPLTEVYPVEAEPTAEHARMLVTRLAFLRREVLPRCQASRPFSDDSPASGA